MLYIVATPIGNLEEITPRATEVLRSVELIAAEDTRHTAILLDRYRIKTRTVSYHKFNEKSMTAPILELLESGKDVALVSDAGMPTVSDPGHILIDAVIEKGLEFTVVSGPCAAVNALVLSGMDTRCFAVLGFIPEKKKDRERFLAPYVDLPATLVFYSAVHDIERDLGYLFEAFGARRVAVCREMTKMFESVVRGRLGEKLDIVEKGEFAVVVEGAKKREFSGSVEEHIRLFLAEGLSEMEAVKKVAAERGVAKSEVYRAAVAMKEGERRP